MQTQTEPRSLDAHLKRLGTFFIGIGWLSFWVQLALAVAAGLCLLFAISGRNVSQEGTPGIQIGIVLAILGILVLLFNLYLALRFTHIGRRLRHPNPALHPPKLTVVTALRFGAVVGFVGLLLTILGGGATIGILLAKSIAQPQGVAIYDPQRIIRALDIFVAMANMNTIAAHFVGAVSSLGLLNNLSDR